MARSSAIWAIVIILLAGIAFLALGPQLSDYFHKPESIVQQTAEQPVNKQLKLIIQDQFAGGTWTSGSIYIYDSSYRLLESGSIASDGSYITALNYRSGTMLHVYLVNGANKLWTTITVPYMSAADAESNPYNIIAVKAFTLPSSLTLKLGFESNIASDGQNLSIAGKAGTLELYITREAGRGYIESKAYDFTLQKLKDWRAFAVIEVPRGFVVNGAIAAYDTSSGTVKYLVPLNPEDISAYSIETKLTVSKAIGFDASAVSSGTITVTIYVYADPTNFSTAGALGSDAVSLATITVNIA